MKNFKKVLSAMLAASMVLSMAACGNDNSTPSSSVSEENNGSTSSSQVSVDNSNETSESGETTFLTYMDVSPKTWNPHEWETSTDSFILNSIESSFWSWTLNDDGTSFRPFPDATTALPEDITEQYAGDEKWGIPADAKNGDGLVYKVTLREDLCWEDGTPIKAVDFVESVKRILDPAMKNYRASDVYDSSVIFVNAKNYYWDGMEDGSGNPTKKVEWDDVGLKATGEYELTYILAQPCSQFYLMYNGSLPLVKLDLYDSLKEDKGDIVKTKYNTSIDTTVSWGQYKLTGYQEDKFIKMEKNENWYGWNDPDYEGKKYLSYEAIDCQIVKEHATALMMFLQGQLDSIGLNSQDIQVYGSSDYLHLQPKTYTTRISFNSDYDKLKAMEEGKKNVCKTMPSYYEFRKAFSRMINRKEYCSSCTACSVPGFGLFNRLYISDPEKGIIYRDTKEAQQALLNVYGGNDVNEISGYSLEEAKELFQQAYEKAKANGDYRDGDMIEIVFTMWKDDETTQKIINHLQDKFNEATEGTGFEGKGKFILICDEDYYAKAHAGDYEVIFATLGGAAMNIPSLLVWYTDEGKCNEFGSNPSTTLLKAEIEGKEYEMTYYQWQKELTSGIWATSSPETKNKVIAVLEENILNQFRTIPMYYQMGGTLLSHRTTYECEEYLPMIGFGATIMNMNDAEWNQYIKDNNGKLSY